MVWTPSSTMPKVSSSNPATVSVSFEKQTPAGYLFRINRLAQGTAEITTTIGSESHSFAAVAGPSVKSDTTMTVSLQPGDSYTFKMTILSASTTTPQFTVGNGSVFKTQFVKKDGSDYYFKITATGKPGAETGVYTTMPGESAVQQCIAKIV